MLFERLGTYSQAFIMSFVTWIEKVEFTREEADFLIDRIRKRIK